MPQLWPSEEAAEEEDGDEMPGLVAWLEEGPEEEEEADEVILTGKQLERSLSRKMRKERLKDLV